MPKQGDRAAHRVMRGDVLDLHTDGLSVSRIATRLGITPNRAQRLLGEAIAALPAQDVEELRATSELRLDRAAETLSELAKDPDPRIRLQATAQLVTVERDRARLLGTAQRQPKDD